MQASLSLDPSSIAQHYSHLTTHSKHTPAHTQLNQQQCTSLYSQGLAAAANLQQQAVKPATLQARSGAAKELADWLFTTEAVTERTMLTAVPEDILVYLTEHWLPAHAGSSTMSGTTIAAPSSLASIKSHLATEFDLLGRTGTWDSAAQTGNPMHSTQVKGVLRGYANAAASIGYQKKGAVPLTEAEMHMLLSNVLSCLGQASGQDSWLCCSGPANHQLHHQTSP